MLHRHHTRVSPSHSPTSMIAKTKSLRAARTAVCLTFALVLATPAAAQTWNAHLNVGMASSTFTGQSDNAFNRRSAFAGGGGLTFNVSDEFGIRSELHYVIRGAVARDAIIDGQQTELDVRFAIAYIDLPILAVARLPLSGPVSPYVFAGGALSRNVDAAITLISPSGEQITDDDSSISLSEFSLVGGGGIDIRVSTEVLFVEGRFVGGRHNVRPDRPDAPLNNRSILIVVGLRF